MKVDVIIPTLGLRKLGLAKMIASVERHSPGTRCIVAEETGPRPYAFIIRDLIKRSDADVVVWGGDSCEWTADCAGIIARAFEEHFPDTDGCAGLHMTDPDRPHRENCFEFCFMAIGRKFWERFPDDLCICPLYQHFWTDTELGLFARSLGKFQWLKKATVLHPIPKTATLGRDETHKAGRAWAAQDGELRKERAKRGMLWGQQFGKERSRIIVQAVTGDTSLIDLTGPSVRAYAERIGVEYRLVTDPVEKGHTGHWVKLCLDEIVAEHDQTLWVDADVFIRATAPNIFDCVPDGEFAAWFEEGRCNRPYYSDWPMFRHGYFNSGVMVLPREAAGLIGKARAIFDKPDTLRAEDKRHLFWDQTPLNAAFERADIPWNELDIRWNHWIADDRCAKFGFHPVKDAWFVHFAGGVRVGQENLKTKEEQTNQPMRAELIGDWMDANMPGELREPIIRRQNVLKKIGPRAADWSVFENDPANGDTAMLAFVDRWFPDRTDLNILEIGTCRGVGASILATRGHVTTLDVRAFEEVESVLAAFGTADRVVRIVGPPDAVRASLRGRTFDLVFIDGLHEYEPVKQDWEFAETLTRHILMHDYCPMHRGVMQLVEELKKRGDISWETGSTFAAAQLERG